MNVPVSAIRPTAAPRTSGVDERRVSPGRTAGRTFRARSTRRRTTVRDYDDYDEQLYAAYRIDDLTRRRRRDGYVSARTRTTRVSSRIRVHGTACNGICIRRRPVVPTGFKPLRGERPCARVFKCDVSTKIYWTMITSGTELFSTDRLNAKWIKSICLEYTFTDSDITWHCFKMYTMRFTELVTRTYLYTNNNNEYSGLLRQTTVFIFIRSLLLYRFGLYGLA